MDGLALRGIEAHGDAFILSKPLAHVVEALSAVCESDVLLRQEIVGPPFSRHVVRLTC